MATQQEAMAPLFNAHTIEEIEALYAISISEIVKAALRVQLLNRFKRARSIRDDGYIDSALLENSDTTEAQALCRMYGFNSSVGRKHS